MPTFSFQRLKPSQVLLFSAGVLDIWLKEKRMLLFDTVERQITTLGMVLCLSHDLRGRKFFHVTLSHLMPH